MDGVLKRILNTICTDHASSEILTAETGIMDIDTTWKRKQIIYYHRIMISTIEVAVPYLNSPQQLLVLNAWKKTMYRQGNIAEK